MTTTGERAESAPASHRPPARRDRFARLERPLLVAGLALVTVHLLGLAFSGPDTALSAWL